MLWSKKHPYYPFSLVRIVFPVFKMRAASSIVNKGTNLG